MQHKFMPPDPRSAVNRTAPVARSGCSWHLILLRVGRALVCGRCAMILLAAATAENVHGQVYSVKDLGPMLNTGGRDHSQVHGINNRRQVVMANSIGGAYRALLYEGSWSNLGTLGGVEGFGLGLNDIGQVVGRADTGSGTSHAFRWTPGGTNGVPGNTQMEDLGTLGGQNSEATSVNRHGEVTGFAQTESGEHAFIYAAGTMTDIGVVIDSFLNLPWSYGFGINGLGHVVGGAYTKNFSSVHAFYFDGTSAIDLGHLGQGDAFALAVNDAGQVTGYSAVSGNVDRAFLYDGTTMHNLGTLGGNYSYGQAINASGVVVGGSFIDSQDDIYHAFVSTTNDLVDLNDCLDESGADWELVEAFGINDSGQIIGEGLYRGVYHVFLLNPAPRIVEVTLTDTDVKIDFSSINTASYTLESTSDLRSGDWSNQVEGISGTGGIVTVVDPLSAEVHSQYLRVKLTDP